MTTEQVIKKLAQAEIIALRQVGEIAIGMIEPFVPVWLGNLRRSARVETKGNEVIIVYGGKSIFATRPINYAKKQYYENLRHWGSRGDYKDLSRLDPGKSDKRKVKSTRLGSDQDAKYWRAYRHAVRNKMLTKSSARWAEVVTKDKSNLQILSNIYTKVLKNILK